MKSLKSLFLALLCALVLLSGCDSKDVPTLNSSEPLSSSQSKQSGSQENNTSSDNAEQPVSQSVNLTVSQGEQLAEQSPEQAPPSINLKEIADKIVEKFPPTLEGVELVYESENVDEVFDSLRDVERENVISFIKVYNPNPSPKRGINERELNMPFTNTGLYYFAIAEVNNYQRNAIKNFVFSMEFKNGDTMWPYIESLKERTFGSVGNYVYIFMLSNVPDEPNNKLAEEYFISLVS